MHAAGNGVIGENSSLAAERKKGRIKQQQNTAQCKGQKWHGAGGRPGESA